jgi:hypothetical protein
MSIEPLKVKSKDKLKNRKQSALKEEEKKEIESEYEDSSI